jgi:hypothetical protein
MRLRLYRCKDVIGEARQRESMRRILRSYDKVTILDALSSVGVIQHPRFLKFACVFAIVNSAMPIPCGIYSNLIS